MAHHAFVPPAGHVPQTYDHSPAASHQTEPVNINSQQQTPASINNHHPANITLAPMPPVISTAATGTTNVHQLGDGGPMLDPHMQSRLSLNQQQAFMYPHFVQNTAPFNPIAMMPFQITNLTPYHPRPMPPPSPSIMPARVPTDLGVRQPFDPPNPTAPLSAKGPLGQPMPTTGPSAPATAGGAAVPPPPVPAAVPKPPVAVTQQTNMIATSTPITPLRPRERKALAIVNPVTKHVYTEDELKNSPSTGASPTPATTTNSTTTTPTITTTTTAETPPTTVPLTTTTTTTLSQSQSSKDLSNAPRISPNEPQNSNQKEPESDLKVTNSKTAEHLTSSEIEKKDELRPVHDELDSRKPEQEPVVVVEPVPAIVKEKPLENGGDEFKVGEEKDLINDMSSLSISVNDNSSEAPTRSRDSSKAVSKESSRAPSKEPTQNSKEEPLKESTEDNYPKTPVRKTNPNLPYEAGQFSPLNPNGRRKYSIAFLRAVEKEMTIDPESPNPPVDHFVPHFVRNHGNYIPSQPLTRRSSQQAINKPRKIITTHSLQQEVELKTAEKPWRPELEAEKSKISEDSEMDTKRLLKVFRGHLNKLTPQKYDSLIEKIIALDLSGPERLSSVIDLVFDKAVDEPGFCELYARMCKMIANKNSQFCFHLVKKCQDEFETSDLYDGLNVDERKQDIDQEADVNKKKLMTEELYEDMRIRRRKYLGTIKLIGEMYKLGLLLPKIIGFCMSHLINEASNENLECLCSLITTVGAKMASEPEQDIKKFLKNILSALYEVVQSKKTSELFTLESRIKFKILDTIDLSKRNWRPRMVENNPKKIEELREEAREEQIRQYHHNHSSQSKSLLKPDDRERPRRVGQSTNSFSKGSAQKW